MRHVLQTLLGVILLSCWGSLALAQARYSCRLPDGSFAVLNRPCPEGTTPGKTYYPPIAPPAPAPAPSYRQQTTAPPPDFLPLLSARCSSMNDAVRTSAARGLGYQASQELRRNYQHECGAEENLARQQMYRNGQNQAKADNDARRSAVNAEVRSEAERDQCRESMRIIVAKRARTNLTEPERAELQRFEDNIRARCV